MNKRPILHLLICCQNCSSAIKQPLKKLFAYSKRQNQWCPYADICIDTPDDHEEKIFQQRRLGCSYLLLHQKRTQIITSFNGQEDCKIFNATYHYRIFSNKKQPILQHFFLHNLPKSNPITSTIRLFHSKYIPTE
ncbi:hypothetical protein SAMN05661086_02369 [Anaeromicropila populeti]|uniref:Uncharacterized protein n=1 Tax=Anaeromicropila populeti TaxID=37658 RepID=A0A1I6KDI1_9FIRM|nr:hypothetical protein SAMN05661086_02369 [Anaeromicropila populeti]